MGALYDHQTIAAGIKTVIAAGRFNSAAVKVYELSASGEIHPNSVAIGPPRLVFAHTGEAPYVDATEWPLHLISAHGRQEATAAGLAAFTDAVVTALVDHLNNTLGGVSSGFQVQEAQMPDIIEAKNQRKLLRRILLLRIEH